MANLRGPSHWFFVRVSLRYPFEWWMNTWQIHSLGPGSTNIAKPGKWTRIEDVFPIDNGDVS